MSIILTKCISNFAASCRGGPVAAKSPVAISDLVLLHSYVTQGLSLSKKDIKNASYDFWSSCPPPLKESWIKFFKVHTSRIGNLKSQLRITPIPEDHPTTVQVPGFVLIWNKKNKRMADQAKEGFNFELQFLEHHKDDYFKLGAKHNECANSPKTRDDLESL